MMMRCGELKKERKCFMELKDDGRIVIDYLSDDYKEVNKKNEKISSRKLFSTKICTLSEELDNLTENKDLFEDQVSTILFAVKRYYKEEM